SVREGRRPVRAVHLPDDLRMHLLPAQVVGDFDGRVQGVRPPRPPEAAAGVRGVRRVQGRLMPTKLPSFSRASAHRNAPTSGLSKKNPTALMRTRSLPRIERFQSLSSL